MENFTLIGHLESGDAIYFNKTGGLAVEKDHQFLAYPTSKEVEEIYNLFPHIRYEMDGRNS